MTWMISNEVKSIQENAAKEAALARDNDALLRFGENLMRSWGQMAASRNCIRVLNFYMSDPKFKPIQRGDFNNDWITAQFQVPLQIESTENARKKCLAENQEILIGAIYYSLISYESALINWKPNLPIERKGLYYKHLTPGICFKGNSISRLLHLDKQKLNQAISAAFPGISSFHRECDSALIYTNIRLSFELSN